MIKSKLVSLLASAFLALQPYSNAPAASRPAQSLVIGFPASGRVIVQAQEEIGKNPRMILISERTGKVLLDYGFQGVEDRLKPTGKWPGVDPFLRFRVIHSGGFRTPLILAVAVALGGSDEAYWGVVIGEVDGILKALTQDEMFIQVQGGFYAGFLNKELGYGLVVWNFDWVFGDEIHYDYHHYEVEVFTLKGDRFVSRRKYLSKHRYKSNGAKALRELGIYARDLRVGIPRVREHVK
jgi:hypothetical protein